MARIFITGASGFIGQHVVSQFVREGHELTCLVRRKKRDPALSNVSTIVGDLTQPESYADAIQHQDFVLNLAARTRAWRLNDLLKVNQDGLLNLAKECARQTNPPTLIQISSLAANGPSNPNFPLIEQDVPQPVSNYGRSKLAGEKALRELSNQLPISVIRPGIVYGEGDRKCLRVFNSISRWGLHLVPTVNDHVFSAIHVRDLVDSIQLVMQSGERMSKTDDWGVQGDGLYFASGPEALTYADLGREIGNAIGRSDINVVYLPKAATWTIGCVSEAFAAMRGQSPVISLDKINEGAAGDWHCSSQKLCSLGFQPMRLQTRLQQTAQWYMEQGWLRNPIFAPSAEAQSTETQST